jgi:hypothetical protein
MYIVAHRSGVERIVRKPLTRRALATLCATPLLVAIDFGGAPVARAQELASKQAETSQQSDTPQQAAAQSTVRRAGAGHASRCPGAVLKFLRTHL